MAPRVAADGVERLLGGQPIALDEDAGGALDDHPAGQRTLELLRALLGAGDLPLLKDPDGDVGEGLGQPDVVVAELPGVCR